MAKTSNKEQNVQNTNVTEQAKGANAMENKEEKDYSNVNYATACVDNGFNPVTGEAEFTTKWLSEFVSKDGRQFPDILQGLNTLVRFGAMESYCITTEANVVVDEKGKTKTQIIYNIKTIGLDVNDSYNTKNGVRMRFKNASKVAETIKKFSK